MYAVELVAKRLLESYFSQNYGKRKFKKNICTYLLEMNFGVIRRMQYIIHLLLNTGVACNKMCLLSPQCFLKKKIG